MADEVSRLMRQETPAHYTRNERAGRGAVAQYYCYRPVKPNGAREGAQGNRI